MTLDSVLVSITNRVMTITFNEPKRCNAWGDSIMNGLRAALYRAQTDSNIRVVILTGNGKYYSSGVDFAGSMQVMRPSKLTVVAAKRNEELFNLFIDFPKPIIAAVNGPAIGAPVTSATLCDAMLVSEKATFLTPFSSLALPAEGCSSYTFPLIMGEARAKLMLEEGQCITAVQALEFGLATEVTKHADLLFRAQELAEQWIVDVKVRNCIAEQTVDKLKAVNKDESRKLGLALVSKPFLEAQYKFAVKKNNSAAKWLFGALVAFHPIVSRL